MRNIDWVVFFLLTASSAMFSINLLAQNPVVGAMASVMFISSASVVLGKWFFKRENRLFQISFGFLTLILILSLSGVALVITAQFTEPLSLCLLIALYVVFLIFLNRAGKEAPAGPAGSGQEDFAEKSGRKSYMHLAATATPFALSVVASLVILWSARTGEGGASVWIRIPSIFGALYLAGVFSLFVLVFSKKIITEVKIGAICVFSLLSHSLFVLVWYPGRYGDPWSHLGQVRYIVRTGAPYAYSWILQNNLWIDLVKFRGLHALVAFLERMFRVDVYWIYILSVPVLWSIFAPLLAYKAAEILAVKKSRAFPYLAALATILFPSLISWGAVSVPNSLGFLLFFTSIVLLLMWMKQGERHFWLAAAFAVIASFLTHPQAGTFAIMFLISGTTIQKTNRKTLWIAAFLGTLSLYPIALYLHNAQLAGGELYQMSSFLAFESEISTILLVFGLVGLILGIRGKYVDAKSALLLFSFYIAILFEYYFTKYGMTSLPYGPARILAMADLLLAPLVALGFWTLVTSARKGGVLLKDGVSSLFSRLSGFGISRRMLGLLLVGLFVSLQATAVLYQAYPQNELVKVQPSSYELEAIRFIESNYAGRYVVLCEPGFSSLAVGFLGADYGYLGGKRGLFGYPEWWYPTVKMYLEMTKNPSTGILQEAIDFSKADIGYFVISVRNPDFDAVVKRVLDIFPGYETFGNDQLYVFWYPLPIYEKEGSAVTVVFDDGLGGEQNVTTTLSYMTESETNATLLLSGHTSYRVQNLPQHWTFRELMINGAPGQFDNASDINSFVYVRGLQPSDTVRLRWLFNAHYTKVGWKEDSFKGRVWRQGPYISNATPTVTSNGNILTISHSFTTGSYQYYYYSTSVDLSTNDYPYVLMRWRADQSVAVAAVYFDTGGSQEIVQLGSTSPEWSSIFVQLPSNVFVRTVMVGFNNARNQRVSGFAQIQIDYILFSAKSTP